MGRRWGLRASRWQVTLVLLFMVGTPVLCDVADASTIRRGAALQGSSDRRPAALSRRDLWGDGRGMRLRGDEGSSTTARIAERTNAQSRRRAPYATHSTTGVATSDVKRSVGKLLTVGSGGDIHSSQESATIDGRDGDRTAWPWSRKMMKAIQIASKGARGSDGLQSEQQKGLATGRKGGLLVSAGRGIESNLQSRREAISMASSAAVVNDPQYQEELKEKIKTQTEKHTVQLRHALKYNERNNICETVLAGACPVVQILALFLAFPLFGYFGVRRLVLWSWVSWLFFTTYFTFVITFFGILPPSIMSVPIAFILVCLTLTVVLHLAITLIKIMKKQAGKAFSSTKGAKKNGKRKMCHKAKTAGAENTETSKKKNGGLLSKLTGSEEDEDCVGEDGGEDSVEDAIDPLKAVLGVTDDRYADSELDTDTSSNTAKKQK